MKEIVPSKRTIPRVGETSSPWEALCI